MVPEEDLRADFARLARQEPPPTGLYADGIMTLAHRRRRVRRTAGMLVSGGLTAAVIILTAVVLPGGTDDAPPSIPAGPAPSSGENSPRERPSDDVTPPEGDADAETSPVLPDVSPPDRPEPPTYRAGLPDADPSDSEPEPPQIDREETGASPSAGIDSSFENDGSVITREDGPGRTISAGGVDDAGLVVTAPPAPTGFG
ncbi:hypothetical protein FHR81_000088 [Actinoalloteichus hoggarensis]|uniref:Uncharacterized protein n=1 Tax=Actinoalloteichus hoggarensis TaxID=1470176 RepID=A0A221W3J7_9PSEU|nr:hypothetical protein [Actinoalloteichus hoggarensis]ASO20227.1 hypothetical protein AHOG_12920 [Actinoalloteichus hoggarensis]MBB5919059.1 hypothetical protein [Actinoalloteichus hoggarensis]